MRQQKQKVDIIFVLSNALYPNVGKKYQSGQLHNLSLVDSIKTDWMGDMCIVYYYIKKSELPVSVKCRSQIYRLQIYRYRNKWVQSRYERHKSRKRCLASPMRESSITPLLPLAECQRLMKFVHRRQRDLEVTLVHLYAASRLCEGHGAKLTAKRLSRSLLGCTNVACLIIYLVLETWGVESRRGKQRRRK